MTDESGVVYLGRVPPYMKPAKVKHLLSQFGEVSRVYLAEEDASVAKKRRKEGKKKCYVEGWIEFAQKKIAKRVAASLNNTPMGGKKRGHYAHDLWNLRYLKGFKWVHLTEKIAYERRVMGQQLRMRVADSQKMHADYLKRIDQRKAIDAIKKRKGDASVETEPRNFKQRKTVDVAHTASDSLLAAL